MTVTVSLGEEHCEDDAESVTFTEYVDVEVGEALMVEELADPIDVVHVPSEYHW